MDFDSAFHKLLGHEGGYSNDPRDPGGETYKGVSRRAHPTWQGWVLIDQHKKSATFLADLDADAELQRLVRELYLHMYWGAAGCDTVPGGIKFDLFDMAVNSGVRTAIKTLQRAVGETQDGILGKLTLQAIQSMPAPRLVARFNGARLDFMTGLSTWKDFGRGWARRIASNLMNA